MIVSGSEHEATINPNGPVSSYEQPIVSAVLDNTGDAFALDCPTRHRNVDTCAHGGGRCVPLAKC
jgi:hypothetical protein